MSKLLNEERRRVAVLYQEGMTIRAIAAETGVAYTTVHRILKEYKVVMRSRGGNRKSKD